jgi:UDP-2-acetamido-3-amino-2,3-dideoxy-glucuronate N-acetyltransferase
MIHPSASVHLTAVVGDNSKVWHGAQICAQARVGDDCIVGSQVYIDRDVTVGDKVKIQTGAHLYHGCVIEDGVFIGPQVCLTNDKYPRAITPDGRLKGDADWVLGKIRVCYGASLGAGAIIVPDVTIGRFAVVAAGAVVTESVPDYGLVVGVPARLIGFVCACGHRLRADRPLNTSRWTCPSCARRYWAIDESTLAPVDESAVVDAVPAG